LGRRWGECGGRREKRSNLAGWPHGPGPLNLYLPSPWPHLLEEGRQARENGILCVAGRKYSFFLFLGKMTLELVFDFWFFVLFCIF
jgi:hypothetical protein